MMAPEVLEALLEMRVAELRMQHLREGGEVDFGEWAARKLAALQIELEQLVTRQEAR